MWSLKQKPQSKYLNHYTILHPSRFQSNEWIIIANLKNKLSSTVFDLSLLICDVFFRIFFYNLQFNELLSIIYLMIIIMKEKQRKSVGGKWWKSKQQPVWYEEIERERKKWFILWNVLFFFLVSFLLMYSSIYIYYMMN